MSLKTLKNRKISLLLYGHVDYYNIIVLSRSLVIFMKSYLVIRLIEAFPLAFMFIINYFLTSLGHEDDLNLSIK